jgi:ABC-type dipeptide/oligopeptide/nickel transport system permease component
VVNFIIRKMAYGLLVLYGVVTLVFLIFSIQPGDPARMMLGQRATQESIEAIKKDLGLDLPLAKQYALYMNDLMPLSLHNPTVEASHVYLSAEKYDFKELVRFSENRALVLKKPYLRRSYQTKQKVSEVIAEAMPGTIVLAITSIMLAIVLGILIGVIAAVKKDGFFDNSMFVIAVMGMSGPSFFMAIIVSWIGATLWYTTTSLPGLPILLLLIGLTLGVIAGFKKLNKKGDSPWRLGAEWGVKGLFWGFGAWLVGKGINGLAGSPVIPLIETYVQLPGTGLNSSGSLYSYNDYTGEEYLDLKNLILPALTLGIRPLAIFIQLTRNSMLEVLSADFIRTARSKGLSNTVVVVRHALRNSLNPVITAISGWFAYLLAGAVFIEYVFTWKGLGFRVYDALIKEDLPVVMGAVIIIATTFVVINILVDILYGLLDPRVRIR